MDRLKYNERSLSVVGQKGISVLFMHRTAHYIPERVKICNRPRVPLPPAGARPAVVTGDDKRSRRGRPIDRHAGVGPRSHGDHRRRNSIGHRVPGAAGDQLEILSPLAVGRRCSRSPPQESWSIVALRIPFNPVVYTESSLRMDIVITPSRDVTWFASQRTVTGSTFDPLLIVIVCVPVLDVRVSPLELTRYLTAIS